MNNNYIGVDLDLFRQPKIQRLEVAHGKGAVAIYLQVYLKLAELGGKANIEDLALWEREFFIKKETLEEVVFFPDLFVVKDNFLHSKAVDAKLNRIKNKSEKARASANARWSKTSETSDTSSNADAMRTHNERSTNKENKIKEKKITNKEIIDEFFETENLEKIIKENLVPYENQEWFEMQAIATIKQIKESMLDYYASKKQIKNIKSTFINWIKKMKRTDFYSYTNKLQNNGTTDIDNYEDGKQVHNIQLSAYTDEQIEEFKIWGKQNNKIIKFY
jgi:hypothetical protein